MENGMYIWLWLIIAPAIAILGLSNIGVSPYTSRDDIRDPQGRL